MAENDAPEASESAANDAQAAAGGSDAPIGEADLGSAGAGATDADQVAGEDQETGASGDGGDGATEGSGAAGHREGDEAGSGEAAGDHGFDVEAAEGRLAEVGDEIEKGKHALADMEAHVDPKPDGPPIAEGEGAANAPPG